MQTINCEGIVYDKNSIGIIEKILSDELVNHSLIALMQIMSVSLNLYDQTMNSLINFYTITSPKNVVSSQNKIKIFDLLRSLIRMANYGTHSIVKFNKQIKELNPNTTFLKELFAIKFTGDFELFENKMDALFDKETRGYAASDFMLLFYTIADEMAELVDNKVGNYAIINKLAGVNVWNKKYEDVFLPAETDYYPILNPNDRKIINDIASELEPFNLIKKQIIAVRSGIFGADYKTLLIQLGYASTDDIDKDEQLIDDMITKYRNRINNALDYINYGDPMILDIGKASGFNVPMTYKKPFTQKIDAYRVVRDAKLLDSMKNAIRVIDNDTFHKLDDYNKHLSVFDEAQKYTTIFQGSALFDNTKLFANNEEAGATIKKLMDEGIFDSKVLFKNLDDDKRKLYDIYNDYMDKTAKKERKRFYSDAYLHSLANIYPVFKAFISKMQPEALSYIFDPDSSYNLYNSILALIAGFVLGPKYVIKKMHKSPTTKVLEKMLDEVTLAIPQKEVKPEFNIFDTQDDMIKNEIENLKKEFEKKGVKLSEDELAEKFKIIKGGSKMDVQVGQRLFSVDYKDKIKKEMSANEKILKKNSNIDDSIKKDLVPILAGVFGNKILEKDFTADIKKSVHSLLCHLSGILGKINGDVCTITTVILGMYYILNKFYVILFDEYIAYLKKYGGNATFDNFYEYIKKTNRYNLIPHKNLETIEKDIDKAASDEFVKAIYSSNLGNGRINLIRRAMEEEKMRNTVMNKKN